MSTLVAIDLGEAEATLVTADASRAGKITILGAKRLPLADLALAPLPALSESPASNASSLSPTPANGFAGDGSIETEPRGEQFSQQLDSLVQHEVDFSLGIVRANRVLFETLNLPFNDPRRLDQIVPLQLQDLMPFDVEDFVVDSVVVAQQKTGAYDILSSLVHRSSVGETLSTLSQFGASPKLLTTKSSAVAALVQIAPEELKGTFALLLISREQASLALFVDSHLRSLREIPLQAASGESFEQLFRDLRCSIARLEHEWSTVLERFFVVGTEPYVAKLSTLARMPFTPLDLSRFVNVDAAIGADVNELAWALGLFSNEITRSRSSRPRLLDFRRGEFAFKPGWSNLSEAIQDQAEWFVFVAFWLIAWVGSLLYLGNEQVARFDREIQARIASALPGEIVPTGSELNFLGNKIADLRDDLEQMGSLSSLSPLESLRELSATVPSELGVIIDAIDIKSDGIDFTGSAANLPAVGKLNGALEKNQGRFCSPVVEPKGKLPGQERTKFEASIKYCE